MRLALAVIGLAAAAVAQEFIPIGGGSGRQGRPNFGGTSPEFGEIPTPSIINPNDPSFQPANFPGNRPNPIPSFTKSQLAGTPHEAPVDFTFIHQHSYKEPFRTDQSVAPPYFNPVGAARPNIPRTLGRENVWLDPRADPNSAVSRAEAEKKAKSMVFFGLAPPVEKWHRADEFAPSTMPLQSPWDRWYDRFTTERPDPRKQFLLTQTKRPNIVDVPFYGADRGKRQAEVVPEAPILDSDILTSTTTSTLAPLSDAIGTTAAIPALELTTTTSEGQLETTVPVVEDDVIVAVETTTASTGGDSIVRIQTTTATSSADESTTLSASTAAPSTAAPAALTPVNLTAPGGTAATPVLDASKNNADVLAAPTAKRLLDGANQTATAAPIPATFPIPLRPHGRGPRPNTTLQPASTVQKLKTMNRKVPLRTTLAVGNSTTAPSTKKALLPVKLNNAVGSAKNVSRATTRVPLRNTTFVKRPMNRSRVPLRRLLNATSTTAPVSPVPATTATASAATLAATIGPITTVSITPATHKSTLRAFKRLNMTTTARTKAPFRIFSKRPLASSKLPTRTPIVVEPKPAAVDSNNLGTLRTEVNRLLTTVVALQSTVIAQQQRIALLENQLRLRRGAKPGGSKTTRFVAPDGRTVERTIQDIRKGRSIRVRNVVAKEKLRQRHSIA